MESLQAQAEDKSEKTGVSDGLPPTDGHDKMIRESTTNRASQGEGERETPAFHDYKEHNLVAAQPESRVKRFRMRIQYDGTNFSGYQRQAFQGQMIVGSNGKPQPAPRTVQECLEKALGQVSAHRPTNLQVAGRTDKGVHAEGNVVACEVWWGAGARQLPLALNRHLPDDLAVLDAHPVGEAFHPRHSASFRRYQYTIYNHRIRSPFFARSAWHVPEPLDVERMQAAGDLLVGAHDFSTFGKPLRPDGHCVREVMHVRVRPCSPCLILVDLQARAWLYHMVRSIVGTLRHVGAGIISVEDVQRKLLAQDRRESKALAPAHGLSLVEIGYWGEDGGKSWEEWRGERERAEGGRSTRLLRDANGRPRPPSPASPTHGDHAD